MGKRYRSTPAGRSKSFLVTTPDEIFAAWKKYADEEKISLSALANRALLHYFMFLKKNS